MNIDQILCGDPNHILKTMPGASVDLAITDPPYLCGYRDRDGRTVMNDDAPDNVLPVFHELYRLLKPDSYCISFTAGTPSPRFRSAGPMRALERWDISSGRRPTRPGVPTPNIVMNRRFFW